MCKTLTTPFHYGSVRNVALKCVCVREMWPESEIGLRISYSEERETGRGARGFCSRFKCVQNSTVISKARNFSIYIFICRKKEYLYMYLCELHTCAYVKCN